MQKIVEDLQNALRPQSEAMHLYIACGPEANALRPKLHFR